MVPEKQFGFQTTDVTSGVQTFTFRLPVRLVTSLLVSRKVRINNVIKRHQYLNSIRHTLFHFPALVNQTLTNTAVIKF